MKKEQKVKKWEQKKILFSYRYAKMRIAVCNKDRNTLKKIKGMLYSYAEQKKFDLVVDCFLGGEDFLLQDRK